MVEGIKVTNDFDDFAVPEDGLHMCGIDEIVYENKFTEEGKERGRLYRLKFLVMESENDANEGMFFTVFFSLYKDLPMFGRTLQKLHSVLTYAKILPTDQTFTEEHYFDPAFAEKLTAKIKIGDSKVTLRIKGNETKQGSTMVDIVKAYPAEEFKNLISSDAQKPATQTKPTDTTEKWE